MIKHFLSISIILSSLFVGVCTSNVAHGYALDENKISSHTQAVECEHCQAIHEQEINCCETHLENATQVAIVKPTESKVSKDFIGKAFQAKPEISIPEYEKEYEYRLNENKAPPHLQLSLPRLE